MAAIPVPGLPVPVVGGKTRASVTGAAVPTGAVTLALHASHDGGATYAELASSSWDATCKDKNNLPCAPGLSNVTLPPGATHVRSQQTTATALGAPIVALA
jgi:hypothetical protein